jgi:hypothetical protein
VYLHIRHFLPRVLFSGLFWQRSELVCEFEQVLSQFRELLGQVCEGKWAQQQMLSYIRYASSLKDALTLDDDHT